jgi:GT2 family glycosyltransferase
MDELGVVIIGRNEGDRLRLALESVSSTGRQETSVVYVDSNSTDGSVERAMAMGASVVALDLSRPFTAARARNEGFARLLEVAPSVEAVQFMDGDCELVEGWLDQALEVLEERPEIAVVCGRRRERFPEHSIYNRLADIEWNTPVGEAKACGGDALMRVNAFRQVNGFNDRLIAGEEPELCVRLRQAGWKILRIDAEMTRHDLAMTRFSQWWRRAERAGFAYSEGAALHGKPPERHWVREVRGIIAWSLVLPLVILTLVYPTRGMSLLLLLAYPLQIFRIARRAKRNGLSPHDAWAYAVACVVGKFANGLGLLRYALGRLGGRRTSLIEYKSADQPLDRPSAATEASKSCTP